MHGPEELPEELLEDLEDADLAEDPFGEEGVEAPLHKVRPGRRYASGSPREHICLRCGQVKKNAADFGIICTGTRTIPERVSPRLHPAA